MRTLFLITMLILPTGCATGFRAGGPNGGGVNAGVAIGPSPAPVVAYPAPAAQSSGYLPPLQVQETPPPPPTR